MGRRKVNHATVAILESLLGYARSGDLVDIFAVFLCRDGSYDCAFETGDLGDMLVQVRTEVFRAQIVTGAADELVAPAIN